MAAASVLVSAVQWGHNWARPDRPVVLSIGDGSVMYSASGFLEHGALQPANPHRRLE